MKTPKWYEQITYDHVSQVMGFAKSTAENLGYLRDILPKLLAPLAVSWYPYTIGTSPNTLIQNGDNTILFPFEMHHLELTNKTGNDVWLNFNTSAGIGNGALVSNGQFYVTEVAVKELHIFPLAANVNYNNPTSANNIALVVGRRIGLRA